MKIALNGASGFVGTHIQNNFPHTVVIQREDTLKEIEEKLKDVNVVINLAGAPIIKKWTKEYKKVLYNSRIDSTKKLVEAINNSNVEYFISTSAIGGYKNDMHCDESCILGDDFLSNLVKDWEKEAQKAKVPTAILRFGVILGKDGGALAQMLTPFKLGLGGIISDGTMMMSWIDIEDLMQIYSFLIKTKHEGIFNATAPNPVTNQIFTKELGKALHRPTIFPIPKFVLKFLFGEGACVLTDSKEVYPKRLEDLGYKFLYPNIKSSFNHLLG